MFSGDGVTNSGTIIADNSGVVNFNTVPSNTGFIVDAVDNFGSMTATSSGEMRIQETQFTNESGATVEANSGGIIEFLVNPFVDNAGGTIQAGAGGTSAGGD